MTNKAQWPGVAIGFMEWGATVGRRLGWGLLLALVGLLTACGGGGDSFSVQFSAKSITMNGVKGLYPTVTTLRATSIGTTEDPIYVGAEVEGLGIITPISIYFTDTDAIIEVLPDTSLPVGSYQGTLVLMACKDPYCEKHHRGSPYNVSYSVTISPPLALESSDPVSLALAQGTQSSLQSRALVGGATAQVRDIYYYQGSSWLTATVQSGVLKFSADARGLAVGEYQAALSVSSTSPEQYLTIPVTLTVSSGLLLPTQVDLDITPNSPSGRIEHSQSIAVAPGAQVSAWQAQTSADWLVIDTPTGTLAEALRWHVDEAVWATLRYGQSLTATIEVSAGASVSPVQQTVTLTQRTPTLTAVDTLALAAGQAGEVLVWGEGFDHLSDPAAVLRVDGGAVTPLAVNRLGAGLLQLSLPALTAGSHSLQLVYASGRSSPAQTLWSLAPVVRSAQSLAWSGPVQTPVWDALSQSLFLQRTDSQHILRVDLSGASPQLSSRSLVGLTKIGLSRDHRHLLATTADGQMHRLDPATLSTRSSHSLSAGFVDVGGDLPLPVSGDNLAWLTTGNYYGWNGLSIWDVVSEQLNILQNTWPYNFYSGPWAAVSGDGRRMLFTQTASLSPAPPMMWRDAAGGASQAIDSLKRFGDNLTPAYFYQATTDHQGKRWVLDNARVHDFALNTLGQITLPSGWVALRSVLSADSSRLYVYALHEGAVGTYAEPDPIVYWPRIHVYDLSADPVGGGSYPLHSSFDLTEYPACRVTQGSSLCYPYQLSMTLTDDQRTLLVAGDRRLLVVPVPSDMLPTSHSAGAARVRPLALRPERPALRRWR